MALPPSLLNALRLSDEALSHTSETGDHHERHARDAPAEIAAAGFEVPSCDAETRDRDDRRDDIAAPVHDIENRALDSCGLLTLHRLTKRGLCAEVPRFGGKWCSNVSDEDQTQREFQRDVHPVDFIGPMKNVWGG